MRRLKAWLEGDVGAGVLLAALALLFMVNTLRPEPGQFLGGGDMVGQWVQQLRLARAAIEQGQWPLWNPYLAGGLPLLANPQLGLFYPPYWVFWVTSYEQGVAWLGTFHLFWMALGTYLFVRRLGCSPINAGCAAVIMAFNGFMTVRVAEGHPGFLGSVSWLPWLFWAYRRSLAIGTHRSAMVLGLTLCGTFLAGNPAATMLVAFALGLWVTLGLIAPGPGVRRRTLLSPFAVALPFALGLTAVQLFPTVEYLLLSARGTTSYAFASQYSLPVAHLISLILPNFFGEPVRLGYWGEFPHIEYMYYPGVVALLTLTLLVWRQGFTSDGVRWLVFGGLGLVLALGPAGGFHQLLYEIVPPLRYVRVPARFMLLAVFAVAVLCALALERWPQQPVRRGGAVRLTLIVSAVLSGLAVVAFSFYTMQPADDARAYHIGSELLRAALLAALTGLIVVIANGQPARRASALIGLVLIADLWGYGLGQLHLTAGDTDRAWALARAAIAAEPGAPVRVLPWGLKLEQQNRGQDVGLASTNAYDPLVLERTRRFVESVPDPRATTFDLLSAPWLLSPSDGAWLSEETFPVEDAEGGFGLYRRDTALPRTWVAAGSLTVRDLDEALALIHSGQFDARATALVEQGSCPAGGGGSALIRSFSANQVTVTAEGSGVLILSEAWYPGWTARIGDRPVEVLVVNGMLRGVCLAATAGPQEIEFEYRPRWLSVGGWVSAVTIALGLGLLLARPRRKMR